MLFHDVLSTEISAVRFSSADVDSWELKDYIAFVVFISLCTKSDIELNFWMDNCLQFPRVVPHKCWRQKPSVTAT